MEFSLIKISELKTKVIHNILDKNNIKIEEDENTNIYNVFELFHESGNLSEFDKIRLENKYFKSLFFDYKTIQEKNIKKRLLIIYDYIKDLENSNENTISKYINNFSIFVTLLNQYKDKLKIKDIRDLFYKASENHNIEIMEYLFTTEKINLQKLNTCYVYHYNQMYQSFKNKKNFKSLKVLKSMKPSYKMLVNVPVCDYDEKNIELIQIAVDFGTQGCYYMYIDNTEELPGLTNYLEKSGKIIHENIFEDSQELGSDKNVDIDITINPDKTFFSNNPIIDLSENIAPEKEIDLSDLILDNTNLLKEDDIDSLNPLNNFYSSEEDLEEKVPIPLPENPVKKKKVLPKQVQIKSGSSNKIYMEKYSEKSFVVKGDTRQYKEELKKMGGRYNRYLKDSEGNRFPGWVFSMKREEQVKIFIDNI